MADWTWEDQYDRMIRFFDVIDRDHHDISRTQYEDWLWSFFQHTWHLKDWLKNDPALSLSEPRRKRIEQLVSESLPIRITADLANRTKHLTLDRIVREDADFKGAHLDVKMNMGGSGRSQEGWNWTVELANGDTVQARELAREAVSEWQRIIVEELRLDIP